ncbi:hypothetical protein HanRHA438_Chr03g0103021 [Helianthus annuus]|nr:hypothetical protein HanHA300_Chr03g0076981 [Helianthus annuus]KAJ0606702.1 hypothetical protein HanHA89_Chr03g0088121 [Helianthus annuus]KAJ0772644.1 hypothetical protein HanOQP8_Chr03g0089721 [Helianthus annuus]KAJ0934051.1 hypothetical protein HanRHA438_Chr03g0103021 [Helianthus annuus]
MVLEVGKMMKPSYYLCDCIFCRIVLLASAQVFYKIMKTMKIKDED